jgi:hypothetical protein
MLADNVIVKLLFLLAGVAMVYYFMTQAEGGKKFFVRRIAGVDALDAALDRATELGGCVNFCAGDVAQLSGSYVAQTVAGFEILGYIARHCARLRTRMLVTTIGRSGRAGDLVPIQTDIVRDGFAAEGREEDFSPDIIRYLSGDRQGYESAIHDLYIDEKVTTNVWAGPFAGGTPQPIIIANAMGIVNITATARTYQIPLQATIADYFMFGEELFAAGALLSQDPAALSSMRMSDILKGFLIVLLLVGSVAMWAGSTAIYDLLGH